MINRELLLKWLSRILAISIAFIIFVIITSNITPDNLASNPKGSFVSSSPDKLALLIYIGMLAIPIVFIFVGYGKHRVIFRTGWILLLLILGFTLMK